MRNAAQSNSPAQFTQHLAENINKAGYSLIHLNTTIWSLHPLVAGESYIWQPDEEEVLVRKSLHGALKSPVYTNSPVRYVSDGLGGVRQSLLVDGTEFNFPIFDELRMAGGTDYVAFPLVFSDGTINVISLTTDQPGGFTTNQLAQVFECSNVISRNYKVFNANRKAQVLLDTYLGKRTGNRVLGGKIKRGDGETIQATIMFCDLHHSTRLADQLGAKVWLDVLNEFFETSAQIVETNGGEVLKFIGDAVLAIFPDEICDPMQVDTLMIANDIVAAVSKIAVSELDEELAVVTGMCHGPVTWGNVGSEDRLDFTVIGGAANVAARLADLTKKQGYSVLVSQQGIKNTTCQYERVGMIELRNVANPVEVFGCNPLKPKDGEITDAV